MPLPPLNEQHRLVGRLEAVAKGIDQARLKLAEVQNELVQAERNILWRAAAESPRRIQCRDFMRRRPLDVAVEPQHEYNFAGVYSFGRGAFRAGRKHGAEFSYRELTMIRTDDFVYPKLMAWEGAMAVVPPDLDGLVVSPEFPVFEIDREIVHPVVVDT